MLSDWNDINQHSLTYNTDIKEHKKKNISKEDTNFTVTTVCKALLVGHSGPISALVELYSGTLVSACWDNNIRFWGQRGQYGGSEDPPTVSLGEAGMPGIDIIYLCTVE